MTSMEMIETLCALDMRSLAASVEAKDTSLIRMENGEAPTPRQLELILASGKSDFDAAKKEMRERANRARDAAFPTSRLAALLDQYGAEPEEPMGHVMNRMTPEDRNEALGLILWIQETEGAVHGDSSA